MSRPALFSDTTMKFVREQFAHLERDAHGCERLFFENSGGSLRLRAAAERALEVSLSPDSNSRPNQAARDLARIQQQGESDLLAFFNGDPDGALFPTATASQAMFAVVRTIAENVPGTNIVTTALEHPSSYDACARQAERTGRELRVAPADPTTGGIDPAAVAALVDSHTSLVSVIATSNITGAVTDVAAVVAAVRARNPDVYVVTDGVQHAPHGVIDARGWGVDAINIAPYKMFGDRGNAFTYLSPRLARLDHEKLAAAAEPTWAVGSSSPAVYAGFTAIADYLAAVGAAAADTTASPDRRTALVAGLDAIHAHEQALLHTLLDGTDRTPGLRATPGVHVHFADETAPTPARDLILPLTFDRLTCSEAARAYDERGVVVYERVASSPYSERILRAVGLDGIVRVSPLHCHTAAEAERFLEVTREITALR
ncbi:aminotransferase class V-fold PLP-dependent enzyme [Streptomyces sp. AcE210]|uniref:aminotransferase class V-fold PLP-dependent enzyme n=1 Tax=Streptomyces sp. AcE210 TaxID=2292703 RepID=UPI000E307F66|nr:aminotransferase class V-fold PLP-dependent enzyme [Streptomyces sp. AcE210]RFC77220.1 aminotransferase class V-fold PLP-dependent enzyme [Streptomyces sp. AcE210]